MCSLRDNCLSKEQLDCAYTLRNRGCKNILYVRRGYANGKEFGTFYTINNNKTEGATWLVSKIAGLYPFRRVYTCGNGNWFEAAVLPIPAESIIRDLSETLFGDWTEINFQILE